MTANTITTVAFFIVVLGFLAGFWRDLRGEFGGLRDEFTGLRTEVREEIRSLGTELRAEIHGLRGDVQLLGERVARIEGRLDERDRAP